MTARWITADVFDGLATLDDASVDLVITSPPFLALRSYLPADHPDKHKEIGSEPTPAAFIDVMLAVTAELRRVLAPHGSICVELGDTYAGSGGAGGDYLNAGLREGQPTFDGSAARGRAQDREYDGGASDRWDFAKPGTNSRLASGDGWPLAKSKTLIPELYRLALAYGINPLTGQPSPAGRWRVRNKVTWCRPNPPVGALGDKWRPATSDIVIACTSDKRYWDDIATRRPLQPKTLTVSNGLPPSAKNSESPTASHRMDRLNDEQRGAPLLDYWEIPPGGYPGAHYAVYPPALVEPLIKAMAPPKVCQTCGEPSRQMLRTDEGKPFADYLRQARTAKRLSQKDVAEHFPSVTGGVTGCVWNWENGANTPTPEQWRTLKVLLDLDDRFDEMIYNKRSLIEYEHVSDHPSGTTQDATGRIYNRLSARKNRIAPEPMWTDCGHDNWRPAHILDPFAGSGTTLAVATGHGHNATGIDIDERNRDLAYQRIGPLLWEEMPQ